MANTKDEVRVSKNFVNLLKENRGLFYKVLNRLFDIESFSELRTFSPNDIKLEEPFDGFGRMDILVENHKYFLIIENKVHNPTEAQETQTTSYFDLMKQKENEGKKTYICYLINNGHPTGEFEPAVKKHGNAKIDYWNDLVSYLYEDSDAAEKRNIEYFILYSKDEIDNFSVEIDGREKIFGSDVDVLSNPFLLSSVEKFFCGSETDFWILNSFVVPALKEIDGITDVHTDTDEYPFAVFNYQKHEYWLNLTRFYNPKSEKWSYKNSFTFYKPWITGCHKATTKKQMIEYTKKAILAWMNDEDAQTTVLNGEEEVSHEVFGDDIDLFSNPWLLANSGYLITNKKPNKKKLQDDGWIYESIVLPAAKSVAVLDKVEISEDYREVSIKAIYKGIKLDFDLNCYYDSKTCERHEYDTFTFYRPWIIGCQYAKSIEELIEYTRKAIELWLKDIDSELGL